MVSQFRWSGGWRWLLAGVVGVAVPVASFAAGVSFAANHAAPLPQVQPTATAGTPSQASHASAPFLLAGGPGKQAEPSLAGNIMVYSDCTGANCKISGINTGSRQPLAVSNATWTEDEPATDGTRVVWRDARTITDTTGINHQRDTNIMGATLSNGQEFSVTKASGEQAFPSISGNIVVWTDYRGARTPTDAEAGDIYMYDLSTGQETLVSNARSAQVRPVTNGKIIVWQDYRNETDPAGFNSDIYGYDIAGKQEFVISNAADQQSDPAISGNTVVWTDFRKGDGYNSAIYGYDLAAHKEFLVDDAPGNQVKPSISGNIVVWTDFRNDPQGTNSDIYGYDLSTHQEFPVYVEPGAQSNAKVSGNLVVWEDNSNSANSTDIMAANITISPAVPPVALPGSGSQTFPQTGQTVSGIFNDYWKANGGLAQQGYPISGVIGETSDLNGQTYTVQYFERAVFEYHPENQPPYNVLLSQLGTFQYHRKYPTDAPNQTPNNSPGSILFPQTGHRVGGKFLAYWQGHGGLAQQGYPISDEFQEKSDLDGKVYTVQYFERAVFESHPENQPPYDVLLSQLGTFQYGQKYSGK